MITRLPNLSFSSSLPQFRFGAIKLSIESMVGLSLLLLLGREVFAGALRYYLDQFSLASLWFFPDVMILGLLALRLSTMRVPRPMLFLLLAMALEAAVGLISYGNIQAVFSGIKLLGPSIAMVITIPLFLDSPRWRGAIFVLLAVGILGVLVDTRSDLPWTGYSFTQFGQERTASREWWIYGQERLAGFGQASSSSATVLLVLTLLVTRRISRPVFRIVIYSAALWAIYTTTSRTTALALAVAVLVDFWPRKQLRGIGSGPLSVLIVSSLAFFLPTFIGLAVLAAARYGVDILGMNSMMMRAFLTWPAVLDLIGQNGVVKALVGHGYGSIGSPAHYTGLYVSPTSAVDNFFLYILYVYGFPAIAFAIFAISCFLKLRPRDQPLAFASSLLVATLGGEGVGAQSLLVVTMALGYYNILRNGSHT